MSAPEASRLEDPRVRDALAGDTLVGTSGWTYAWPDVYEGVPAARRLEAYAARFDAVEVNASFYGRIREATLRGWRARTPERFRFAMKAHRFLTHYRRLAPAAGSIAKERARARALGDKLGAILWQLPARFEHDAARLDGWLRALAVEWPDTRHVLEPRHRSWFRDSVAASLSASRVAICMSDSPRWPLWRRVTTDLVYVRLHGHTRLYRSGYARASLGRWADRVRSWSSAGATVHVYFDNTDEGHAPRDAERLRGLLTARPASR